MTECLNEAAREALPDLLNGRLGEADRATLIEHVEACAFCSAELALLKEVRRTMPLAPQVDVAWIVAALPAPAASFSAQPDRARRDRGESSMRLRGRAIAASAMAAVITLVAGSVFFARSGTDPRDEPVRTASVPVVSETASPSAAEIGTDSAVQATPNRVAASPSGVVSAARKPASVITLATGGVHDLSDEHLETLIAELEAMESLPSAEPEALLMDIDSLGDRE